VCSALFPQSKHKNLCGHPHEVTLPLSNSCISLHLFCETLVRVFTLIKLLQFILCISNCDVAFPNQQQFTPVIVTKCITFRCCALLSTKQEFCCQITIFSYSSMYTSQISLYYATYMVKIIITYSITHFAIEIWTNFVKFDLN